MMECIVRAIFPCQGGADEVHVIGHDAKCHQIIRAPITITQGLHNDSSYLCIR